MLAAMTRQVRAVMVKQALWVTFGRDKHLTRRFLKYKCEVSMEGKETEGMLKMTTDKRQQKRSRSDREEERDRLSELPDCVVLHIMEFMDTKYAVQTCVLSKRWKDLWKRLTYLGFNTTLFNNVVKFNKFVSRVLSGRDGSVSLLNLEFTRRGMGAQALQ
ncbi:hypothetical protein JHK82_025109 [Glycine max]|nr:hypothetical protein JHK82_025109 [Glycine max]